MKKNRNKLFSTIMMLLLLVLLSSCTLNFTQYYTVILNDGEQTTTQKIEVNTSVTLDSIIKDGYEFGGWFLDEELTDGPYTSYSSSSTSTLTFYAKWINPDQEAAKEVVDLIAKIHDKVSLDDKQYIEEVSTKYNALSPEVKEYVTNASKLTDAIQTIATLQQQTIDLANEVIELINSLPEKITIEDGERISEVRTKYDQLPYEGLILITNYETLLQKEKELSDLEHDFRIVIQSINDLPSTIEIEDIVLVNKARILYDALPDESKALVPNYQELLYAEAQVHEIHLTPTQITYNLGLNIYQSKQELFTAFFTDFYNFILSRDGGASLKNSNINSLEDFLDLASDPNGGGTTTMRGIGNIAGRYLLSKDLNGVMEDQSIETFIGYCVQNGLYKDLLPFFIRFFAYWRIDERYATLNNYGADFFAEAWAPTVDIAKFFYYTEETSYVKTERMIDCFVNIASVVYGDLPKETSGKMLILPTEIKLRGYTFVGWYDNPQFSGEAITSVNEGQGNITLYAKWIIDQAQKDKDDAEFVDVYIYNLMPTPANPTKANVQKVRALYDALSSEAKALVTRYNTLLEYESLYYDDLANEKTINITIQKPVLFTSFVDMKEQFLTDFNAITNANVTYSDFTTNRYTVMKHIKTFFDNEEMYTKWSFILTYFITRPNPASGLVIQTNRALNKQTGDLEYVSKAIDGFFNERDLTSDTEIKLDFSSSSDVISDSSLQQELILTYTKEGILPTLFIEGYTFKGYYKNNDASGNLFLTVNDNTPTVLYAIFS